MGGADPTAHVDAASSANVWIHRVRELLATRSAQSAEVVEEGLRAWPADPELLLLSALTALAGHQPDRALTRLKRYSKRYGHSKEATLLTAIALGQQKQFNRAWALLSEEELVSNYTAFTWFVGGHSMRDWLVGWLGQIRAEATKTARVTRPPVRPAKPPRAPAPKARPVPAPAPAQPVVADLPKLEARFDIDLEF